MNRNNETDGPQWHQENSEPRVSGVDEDPTQQKSARKKDAGCNQTCRGPSNSPTFSDIRELNRECKRQMNNRKESPMRVAKAPDEPASFKCRIKVPGDLESMQEFKKEANRHETEQRQPAEEQMSSTSSV